CCRRIEASLTDPRSRRAVDVAEAYADRAVTKKVLDAAWQEADDVVEEIDDTLGEAESYSRPYYAALAAHYCALPGVSYPDAVGASAHAAFYALRAVEELDEAEAQGRLLCDVFGRPPSLVTDPSWLTLPVRSVAQAIYDERRFDDMPILADA